MYRVEIASRAQREQNRLREPDRRRVAAAITALADQPRPRSSLKLKGALYRLRAGTYRVIYSVSDREQHVVVLKIARREKDTYQHLEEL